MRALPFDRRAATLRGGTYSVRRRGAAVCLGGCAKTNKASPWPGTRQRSEQLLDGFHRQKQAALVLDEFLEAIALVEPASGVI